MGAAGSHHVLTTALFASEFGLSAAAVLGPQPATAHAEAVLRASLAAELEVFPVPSLALAPFELLRVLRRGDYAVGPGGSGLLGALAYADAVLELEQQIASGALPMPDAIVTAVGSGGTAAGLLAGVVERGLATRVVGVQVVGGRVARGLVLTLAARALRHRKRSLRGLLQHFELTRAELGEGYGHPSERGAKASEHAERLGLRVEPTYTAKAFAHALSLAQAPGKRRVILYWHTLSAHDPPLIAAPGELEPRFSALLLG